MVTAPTIVEIIAPTTTAGGPAELTTDQAADLLDVSQTYLKKLLDDGAIPSRMEGTRRRVCLKDVMAYKQERSALRLAALDELSALDQELGLQ